MPYPIKHAVVALLTVVATMRPAWAQPTAGTTSAPANIGALTDRLIDPAWSLEHKTEAAEALLAIPNDEAVDALRRVLADEANSPGRLVVARAIAAKGQGSEVFVDPLWAMFETSTNEHRAAAAGALMVYRSQEVFGRLVSVLRDRSADRAARLALINAMAPTLDQRAAGAMVDILADKDPAIRSASLAGLEALTGIRSFGDDVAAWQQWWRENQDASETDWSARIARSQARSRTSFAQANQRLRVRLNKSLANLFAATPPDERRALVVGLLGEPMPQVRLAAVGLLDRLLLEPGSDEAAVPPAQARKMLQQLLADANPGVRIAAANLAARVGDQELTAALLRRLEVEQDAVVRRGVLASLGQLRDPRALEVVAGEVGSGNPQTAAAAARALARIAEKNPLTAEEKALATQALLDRYASVQPADATASLREALLTAMGMLEDRAFSAACRESLGDSAATVRLAAVRALAPLKLAESAEWLAPLTEDPDRGVRHAAIKTLAAVGGRTHLATILNRTKPDGEPEADVRQQAWSVALAILANADADACRQALRELEGRTDATDQRIQVMQMLAAALTEADQPRQAAEAKYELALALMEASRPAEATGYLSEAYQALAEVDPPTARRVWETWVTAMLAADDPTVVTILADVEDDAAYAASLRRFRDHVTSLANAGEYTRAIPLAAAALEHLPHRLTVAQRDQMEQMLAKLQEQQADVDRRKVTELVASLTDENEDLRRSAETELQAMGSRAVDPLLAALKIAVAGDEPNADREKQIVAVLAQVAPDLAGYDLQMTRTEKLQLIDSWRQP